MTNQPKPPTTVPELIAELQPVIEEHKKRLDDLEKRVRKVEKERKLE